MCLNIQGRCVLEALVVLVQHSVRKCHKLKKCPTLARRQEASCTKLQGGFALPADRSALVLGMYRGEM